MLQARLGRADFRVVGMSLDMLLQILGALESLATEITLVRLEGHMYSDVGGDMIALDSGGIARSPLAGQVQVVGTLATDMAFAHVFLCCPESLVYYATPTAAAMAKLT
jgi:hypothetical protein